MNFKGTDNSSGFLVISWPLHCNFYRSCDLLSHLWAFTLLSHLSGPAIMYWSKLPWQYSCEARCVTTEWQISVCLWRIIRARLITREIAQDSHIMCSSCFWIVCLCLTSHSKLMEKCCDLVFKILSRVKQTFRHFCVLELDCETRPLSHLCHLAFLCFSDFPTLMIFGNVYVIRERTHCMRPTATKVDCWYEGRESAGKGAYLLSKTNISFIAPTYWNKKKSCLGFWVQTKNIWM